MTPPGFRLRLALAITAIGGLVLAAFAASAWWQIRNERLARLDREISAQLMRELVSPRSQGDWPYLETRLAERLLDVPRGDALLLWVAGHEGALRYHSPHWPNSLDVRDRLPQMPGPPPASLRHPYPPPPPHRRPPPPDPDGTVLAEGSPRPPPPSGRGPREPTLATISHDGMVWRFGFFAAPGGRAALAVSEASIDAELAPMRLHLAGAALLGLILVVAAAWFVAGRALTPLRRLEKAMRTVEARGLDARLAPQGDAEFVVLTEHFNQMLERLERSFLQASRFSGDAAHELRTPLAVLQGEIEQALLRSEGDPDTQRTLARLLAEVRRLAEITRKLLLLARADAGHLAIHASDWDLASLLRELAEDAGMAAPHLMQRLDLPEHLPLSADRELIGQVLNNLLANTIKYTAPDGWIGLSAHTRQDQVCIDVSNAGTLADEEKERLFERFYRGSAERRQGVDGAGLGLSVAREIARAHGGDLRLVATSADSICLRLCLPVRKTKRTPP